MTELVISIVSHHQGVLVARLLEDLDRLLLSLDARVVITINVDEPALPRSTPGGLRLHFVHNPVPRGFAANHNAAFAIFPSRKFCVLNPDLRLPSDPFRALMPLVDEGANAVAAPAVVDEHGVVQDSARKLPTPRSILLKALGGTKVDYRYGDELIYPDWIAGMFMLCDSAAFAEMGGFDERYFLYYEDVDLCCRIRLAGKRIVVDPRVRVVHDARRSSHRDPRYMRWHLRSMLRFFGSPVYRLARRLS